MAAKLEPRRKSRRIGRALVLAFVGPAAFIAQAGEAHADTLREALAKAYLTNPTLQAARAQQRALDESEAIEKANGRPDLTASAQYVEFLKTSPNSFTSPERTLQVGPDLNVPIYSGGAVRNGIKAAQKRIEAGQANLRATESAIFSQVVAAYMDVLRNESLVALAANQVEVLSVTLEATIDRFEIGELTRTDIEQARSRLALAQSDLASTRSNLIAARERYIELVGSAPGELAPPPPLPGMPATIEEAARVALESNPDLIAARQNAEAARKDIDVAGASRLPRLSAFASLDYTDFFGTLGGVISTNFVQQETTARAGLQLTVPLFQGGRPAALQRQAQARAAAALDQEVAAERSVIAQLRSAWSSWQAANAVIESARAAVAAAEISLEGVRAENSIGNRTILDVLNAEQELLSARAQLVTARRNAYVAGFTLLAAMGRAEARDLDLDVGGPLYDPLDNYQRVRGRWFDWDRDPPPQPASTRTVDIPPANAEIAPGSQ